MSHTVDLNRRSPAEGQTQIVSCFPVPDEAQLHILSFAPETSLILQLVSPAFKKIVYDFLKWNKEEIYRELSRPIVNPLLHRCIHNNYISYTIPFSLSPGRNDLQFHVSVFRDIRSLGALAEECSDRILLPQEICQLDTEISTVQDSSLEKVWGRISENIFAFSRIGIPEDNASAQEIRTWMNAPQNQDALRYIRSLDLKNLHLACVPMELALLTGLEELTLSKNQLVTLPENLLHGMTGLKNLDLSNNRLISLPENLLRGPTGLGSLNLSNNRLASLPENLLHGLTKLKLLTLDGNCLVSLPENLLRGLTRLQLLYLHTNRLVSLPENLLRGLTGLQNLNLFSNQLTSLPENLLQGLTWLQELGLSSNRLTSLPENLLQGLTRLERLDLSFNRLTSLPENLLQGLIRLERLDLSFNRLFSLPKNALHGLTGLQKLELYGNTRFLILHNDLRDNENHIALRGVVDAFFNYRCTSPLAEFYQLVAGSGPREAVKEAFSHLPDTIKNAIYGEVWEEAGRPDTDDSQWGEHHAFDDDMQIFYGAIIRYVGESFNHLSGDEKNVVYYHVYCLAKREGLYVDGVPEWGKLHALDNILRLIDAMGRRLQ